MIGRNLGILRKKSNLSYRELSRRSGLSHSFLCDIEKERCNPSIESIKRLAEAFDVEPNFFLKQVVVDSDQTKGESKAG